MVARSSVARWLFAVVLGFATAVSRALAGEPASDPVQSPPPALIAVVDEECPANDEAPLAGVMAFIDPETGELRAPTAEEMRILMAASAGQARLKGAVVQKAVQHPNGMISMVLGEGPGGISSGRLPRSPGSRRACLRASNGTAS